MYHFNCKVHIAPKNTNNYYPTLIFTDQSVTGADLFFPPLSFLKANKSKLTPTLQWTMFEPGSAL